MSYFRSLPVELKGIAYGFWEEIPKAQLELFDAKKIKNNAQIDTIVEEMVAYAEMIRNEIEAAEGTSEQKEFIKDTFEKAYAVFEEYVNNLKAGEVEATVQEQENEAAQGASAEGSSADGQLQGGKRRRRRAAKKTRKAKKSRKARKTRRHH